jgi:hypothetical protein
VTGPDVAGQPGQLLGPLHNATGRRSTDAASLNAAGAYPDDESSDLFQEAVELLREGPGPQRSPLIRRAAHRVGSASLDRDPRVRRPSRVR